GRGNTFSGVKRIAGVTQRDGLPVARRVFLFVQPSMTLIRDAYTELPLCAFEFIGLADLPHLVVGFDASGADNSVTYSFVDPVD
ncbi:MAG: hypothetical protein ACRDAM_11370, partial [Casimicrobium sp.]